MAIRKPGVIIVSASKIEPQKIEYPNGLIIKYAYSDEMYNEIETAVKKALDNFINGADYILDIQQPVISVRYKEVVNAE